MKLSGTKLECLAVGEVHLPRPGDTKEKKLLVLKVRAISLGDEAKGDGLFPDVRPPAAPKLDGKGLPVRDPINKQPVYESNYFDPGYVSLQERAGRMQMVVVAVDALEADKSVAWETEQPKGTVPYYEACEKEMAEAGFTVGDISLIVKRARELGNLDSRKLEEAAQSF